MNAGGGGGDTIGLFGIHVLGSLQLNGVGGGEIKAGGEAYGVRGGNGNGNGNEGGLGLGGYGNDGNGNE